MDEMVQARSRVAILGQELFQTRMTIEANGVSVQEVFKPLIINTGPFLGRETPEAVIVNTRLDREGSVEIGNLEVVTEKLGK